MKKVFCKRCNKEIKKGEKVAGMHTYNNFPEISDECYFHFQCFLDWRNENIENRAKKIYAETIKKVIPQTKEMLKGLGINNEEETNKDNLQEIWIS